MNNKILIICGPTATGKTSLGIYLANKFNGEIISADSRQIYKGMDIGTGKGVDSNTQSTESLIQGRKYYVYQKDGVKIWGYDLATPNQDFSVADYRESILPIIDKILTENKLPIIVGGTGFYIEALVQPASTLGIPKDISLRKSLENFSIQNLQQKLVETDPTKLDSMNNSDRNNPRRLIRAIEIALNKNRLSDTKTRVVSKDNLWIGLAANKENLSERVKMNVQERAGEAFTQEIKHLNNQGFNWNSSAASATGYQEWRQLLDGNLDKRAALEKWILRETQYQKRQLTWFKKNPKINWFNIQSDKFQSSVEDRVQAWYS